MKEILMMFFIFAMGIVTIMIPTNGGISYLIVKIIIGIFLVVFALLVSSYIADLIDNGR